MPQLCNADDKIVVRGRLWFHRFACPNTRREVKHSQPSLPEPACGPGDRRISTAAAKEENPTTSDEACGWACHSEFDRNKYVLALFTDGF